MIFNTNATNINLRFSFSLDYTEEEMARYINNYIFDNWSRLKFSSDNTTAPEYIICKPRLAKEPTKLW